MRPVGVVILIVRDDRDFAGLRSLLFFPLKTKRRLSQQGDHFFARHVRLDRLQVLVIQLFRGLTCDGTASVPIMGDNRGMNGEKHERQQREHVNP